MEQQVRSGQERSSRGSRRYMQIGAGESGMQVGADGVKSGHGAAGGIKVGGAKEKEHKSGHERPSRGKQECSSGQAG